MPDLYTYKVRDKSGELISGVVRGEGESAVETYLESLDLIPVKITRRTKFSLRKLLGIGRGKSRIEDLILVTRNLSTLYRAGIPILKALEIVAERYEDSFLGDTLVDVRNDLEQGEFLSDSMAKHPKIFSTIYIASIRAAETSGKLDMVLDRLSEALEQELITREEIRSATRYPLIVVIAIAIAFVVLTTFVVPKFASFYDSYNAELPMPTQVIITIGNVLSDIWYVLFPVLIAVVYAVFQMLKHSRMRRFVDSALLKLPVFGDLITKISLSRFAYLLSVLIASGTTLIQSFDIVKEAVGNVVIGEEIGKLSAGLREGHSIAESRHHAKHFPSIAISLIRIGLESGMLDMTLKEISRFFDREVRYTSSRLTSLLEPILIVIIGGMVLFLALAIFLPMWNLISVFRG